MRTNIAELNKLEAAPFDEDRLRDFVEPDSDLHGHLWHNEYLNEDVNLNLVVGHDQWLVRSYTWREALHNSEKILVNLERCANNPEFYLESFEGSDIYYISYQGHYYIDTEGFHRTIIARYLAHYNGHEPIIRNARVRRIVFNTYRLELLNRLDSILKTFPHLERIPLRSVKERIDDDTKCIQISNNYFKYRNFHPEHEHYEIKFSFAELEAVIRELEKGDKGFLNFFAPNKYQRALSLNKLF